jgi:hypothetical protein
VHSVVAMRDEEDRKRSTEGKKENEWKMAVISKADTQRIKRSREYNNRYKYTKIKMLDRYEQVVNKTSEFIDK